MKKVILLIIFLYTFQNVLSQETQYPTSFILQENEIPIGFKIKKIDQKIIEKGFQGNPGFLTNELIKRAFHKTQLPFFNKVYVAVYTNKEQEEIVITAFKLNKPNTIFNEIWTRGIALIKEDVLVMLSVNTNSDYELAEIANKLEKRTGLKIITKLEDLEDNKKEEKEEVIINKNTKKVQFIGAINKKVYGIIELELNSKKYQNGLFLNVITGENIPLAGTFKDGILKLKEYENDQEMSGYFEGELQENYIFGDWISPNRKVKVPFAFKVVEDLYTDIKSLYNKLPKQIKKIEKAIHKKDWNTFISYCNQEHYRIQTEEIGYSKEQYVYENIGIRLSEDMLDNLKMTKTPYRQLVGIVINNMKKVEINKVEIDTIYFKFLKYSGTFIFEEKTIPFHFYLDSNYKIIGASG